MLAWWCKTVINVCSLHPLPTFLPHTLSPFVPRLLPFLSACPVALLLCPLFAFINPSISSIILPFPHSPLVWSYFLSLSLFVSQASELGMTSAFYKYILTTMVRVRKLFPFPSSVLSSFIFPPSSLLLFLLFLSLYEPAKVLTGRKYSIGGSTERWGEKRERRRRKKRETFEKRITVWRCVCAEEDGGRKRENKVGVWVMTDVMCPFSSATRHLPEACGVFILLLDMLPSFSSVWINVPFYVARLIFIFSLSSLCPLCGMWSCAFRCTCMHITLKKKKKTLFH